MERFQADFRDFYFGFPISGTRNPPEVFVQKPEPARKLKIATRNSTISNDSLLFKQHHAEKCQETGRL